MEESFRQAEVARITASSANHAQSLNPTCIEKRHTPPSAEMCSGSEEGSYLRLVDFCITQH